MANKPPTIRSPSGGGHTGPARMAGPKTPRSGPTPRSRPENVDLDQIRTKTEIMRRKCCEIGRQATRSSYSHFRAPGDRNSKLLKQPRPHRGSIPSLNSSNHVSEPVEKGCRVLAPPELWAGKGPLIADIVRRCSDDFACGQHRPRQPQQGPPWWLPNGHGRER